MYISISISIFSVWLTSAPFVHSSVPSKSKSGQDGERNLYEQCREHGITCITISHRPALDEFHDYRLVFDGDGGWKYESKYLCMSRSQDAQSDTLTFKFLCDVITEILHETLDPEHGCLGELIDSYQLTETDSDLED